MLTSVMADGATIESRPSEAVVCLVTTPQTDAERIASTVVEEGLAACVNILPLVRSIYRWQGKLQQDDEALLVLKTTRGTISRLDDRLGAIHPYETFELVALDVVAGAQRYLEWIEGSVDPTHA
jgi:periplasmic divalent cation tolerance protein